MTSLNLNGRVALITGGTRGIGKGIAQAFMQAGAKVMIADLSEAKEGWSYALSNEGNLKETTDTLKAQGTIQSTALDVTDAASCQLAVQATVKAFGQLDILVNNAGVVDIGPVDEFPEASWQYIFDVNCKGVFLMTKAALPDLRKSKNASVLNIASIAGKSGHPSLSAYCGSKFAVIGITQSMALEFAPDNIRVNALCPGVVDTAMWDRLMPTNATSAEQRKEELEASLSKMIPLNRPQTVEDMGEAAVYLVSAANTSGASLVVAGGFEMH